MGKSEGHVEEHFLADVWRDQDVLTEHIGNGGCRAVHTPTGLFCVSTRHPVASMNLDYAIRGLKEQITTWIPPEEE